MVYCIENNLARLFHNHSKFIFRCASVDDIESDLLNREEVQTWCLDKGFELVELNPVEEDYDLGKL